MALKIGKTATAKKAAPASDDADQKTPSTESSKSKAQPKGFLKTGKAAAAAFTHAEEQAEKAKNGLYRFMITKKQLDEPFKIMFLDGELNDEGMLDTPMYYEHTVNFQGKWQNFVAPETDEGPDPIQEYNEGRLPALVQAFTVLNFTPYTKKDGTVVEEPRKQLFICKRNTMKRLATQAKKRGGLTGCLFEVTRTSDKAENVGDVYDFEEKYAKKDIVEQFPKNPEMAEPYDYLEVIDYHSRDELIAMGFGNSGGAIKSGSVDGADYSDEL